MHQTLKEMEQLKLDPPFIGHTFDFDELHKALKLFQSGVTKGKVVVRVGGE
jgi:alcohol dehydrogenase